MLARGEYLLNIVFFSLLKNIVFGFIAYLLISWPREILRSSLYILFVSENDRKNLFLKRRSFMNCIDPIGLFTFIFFDFGWTHSPAIDYSKFKGKKLFAYSMFGILSSFILFLFYGVLCRVVNSTLAFKILYTASKWSLTLGLISILPIPPLDASRMLLAFLPSRYYEWYLKFNFYGVIFMLGLLVLWILPMIMQPLIIFISNVTNFIIFRNW